MANTPNDDERAEILRSFTSLGVLIAQMSEPPQSASLTPEGNHHIIDLWEKCRPFAFDYEWPWERSPAA
jgi:hypothetical protein